MRDEEKPLIKIIDVALVSPSSFSQEIFHLQPTTIAASVSRFHSISCAVCSGACSCFRHLLPSGKEKRDQKNIQCFVYFFCCSSFIHQHQLSTRICRPRAPYILISFFSLALLLRISFLLFYQFFPSQVTNNKSSSAP